MERFFCKQQQELRVFCCFFFEGFWILCDDPKFVDFDVDHVWLTSYSTGGEQSMVSVLIPILLIISTITTTIFIFIIVIITNKTRSPSSFITQTHQKWSKIPSSYHNCHHSKQSFSQEMANSPNKNGQFHIHPAITRWWFPIFFIFTPIYGRFPI